MALGTCPECNQSVAPSAESCPHCGNREFYVKTGRQIRYICSACKGAGKKDGDTCRSCHGSGLGHYDQTVDSRDPSERIKAAREWEQNQKEEARDRERIRQAKIVYVQEFADQQRRKQDAERRDAAQRSASKIKNGILLAIVAYPVVGVGGCLVRLVAQGAPPDPVRQTAAHDAWLNFPMHSFTFEAILVPILIIVWAVVSAMKDK